MAEAAVAPILEVTGLRKEFGDLVAVDDVSFALTAGRLARHRGRVRLGQDHDRPDDRRPGAAHRRARSTRAARTGRGRPGRRRTGGAAAARCRSSSRTRTPASTRGRAPRRRSTRCCGCTRAGPAEQRRDRIDRADRAGRARRPAGPGAAAGAVRRPAAAGRDRPGAGRRAAGPDPGRVGRRARRLDPGPGAQPARRHPRRDRRVLHPGQPRPRGGPAAHRRHDRAAARGPSSSAGSPPRCSTTRSTAYTQLLRSSVPRPGWKPPGDAAPHRARRTDPP